MRLIEAYKEWETTQIDGLTYPAECVLEGDDGIRVGLLTSLRAVRGHLWFRLHSSGVRYLVAPEGGAWAAIKTDRYLQLKAEHGDEFTLASGWKVYPSFPSYFDLEDEEVKATEFVHLHAHSDFSPLDGLSKVEEMVEAVVADNQPALALTDHGSCAGHPLLSQTAGKHDIKPIFGIEANFVYDRFLRKNQYDYYHLILWAKTDTGLRNLWAMNTEAYREGFYGRPRMDWDTLSRHAEGVMASTACLRGPVSRRLLEDDEEGARMILSRLLAIFGDDLYVEIQTNSLGEQRKVNEGLISLARDLSLPVILASDSHYPTKADQDVHRVWIAAQTNKDLQDDTGLFVGDSHYHLMTGSEAAESVSYLPPGVVAEAMKNTVVVAEKVEAAMGGKAKPPVFSKGEAPVDKDVDRLLRLCLSNWGRIMGKTNPPEVYEARFEKEMHLLISKGYCGYFLMVSDYCRMARERGILVGPGRGSGAGSLVAYLAGITGIDPVEADLMFERFLTEGRNALPDFDVDFPTSKRQEITDYIIGRYGQENVVRVGTHIRLKNKGVVRALNRVLRNTIDIHYPDIEAISKIIDTAEADKAGLGMSWEDLWDEYEEELTPYKTKYPDLFRYAEKMVGRLHTYGKHAAGVVIAPDTRLTDNLPLRTAGDDIVAEFDMESLESLGLVKFDLLTLSTLDKIQMCVDLIREETGDDIDITAWDEEYRDPVVWEQIGLGNTLGIFQIETPGSTRDTEELKPTNLDELSDVITLVRPGPKRSGLTDLYLKRKRGEEPVSYLDPRLEPILDKTFGCMIYQEQVIRTCMVLAGYNETEADDVRKILGKKKIELVEEAGKTFIERAIANKTSPEVAETIWAQMAEFARYCVTGDTEVWLAGANAETPGRITVEELERRINAPLLEPVSGRTKTGEEYRGPCVVCGAEESPVWTRGACRPCYVWRQKFRDPQRGLYGLTVEADGRVRPCRILMVHRLDPAETWTVTLSDGRQISATANHQHLTPDGLRRVDELSVGDRLMVDAGYEEHRYGEGEYRTTVGERLLAGAVNNAYGETNYGYVDGGFTSLMAWTSQAPDHCEECGHDGSTHRLERAHLDGDRSNNDWSNLRMLCVSCHKRHDYRHNGRRRRWGKGHPTAEVEIVSIERRGVETVYSVVMDDPHIWIANGIATGNSFNRSHAYSYAMLGYWTAWLKFNYPIQFLTAALSTVEKGRIPEFIAEANRMGYRVLPPDINLSGSGFRAAENTIRYGFDGVKGIGAAAVEAITQGQPYTSFDDFMERKGGKANSGVVKLLVAVGAFDSLGEDRRLLEEKMEWQDGIGDKCAYWDDRVIGPNGLPCTFDWSSEPVQIGSRGQPLKPKPIPKRCTKACRNFTPRTFTAPESLAPITPEEIQRREVELLGVYLSSSPFDAIPPDMWGMEVEPGIFMVHGSEVKSADRGRFVVAALISRVRPHTAKTGQEMGFVGLNAVDAELDCVVFSDEWKEYRADLKPGRLGLAYVRKTDRGINLLAYHPI